MRRWVKKASLKGELKITENRNCPFHNPEHKTNLKIEINACKSINGYLEQGMKTPSKTDHGFNNKLTLLASLV